MTVRAILMRAPGTNCDRELVYAFERCGARVELLTLQQLLESSDPFGGAAIVGFPGGFSYGDDVASGKIFAIEMQKSATGAPLAEKLTKFIDRGGLAIGVCNGFQVLVKSGILPGYAPDASGIQHVTLTNNRSGRFEERWVAMRGVACRAEFVPAGELLEMPSAHGEGQFMARDEATLQKLVDDRLVALRYVTKDGREPAAYPDNPNGSVLGIAGICDLRGRVLGLMPHPERNVEFWHHPQWTRRPERDDGTGFRIIKNLVDQARKGN
ncbi:MAG: phosphoribosylformylglycinamidine synthase subunit PurQ [Planctomycetes bacterium]|nr:phosphoribosylformylglycinamidine synthase subunit PurQ [Planctomycetota bacterium]